MKKLIVSFFALSLLLSGHTGVASPRIAVLSFELNDITSLPNTLLEQKRTATIRPLLEHALLQTGNYEIIGINANAESDANGGFGYLFSHHDAAAELGEQLGADWILVGQHSKPSFLFSYLIANLVEVKSQKLVARFDIELKGTHEKVTQHAVEALANKISKKLAAGK